MTDPTPSHDTEDIAVQRALGGTVTGLHLLRTHVDTTGGEHRPQQETMTTAVHHAITHQTPLLAQAGTGTGKSLAYLFPLAATNTRTVIATATNQLSEQLTRHDLPQVQETLAASGKPLSFALLKGRNNYVCLQKTNEIETLETAAGGRTAIDDAADRLFDFDESYDPSAAKRRQAKSDAAEVGTLLPWAKTTSTGDRSDAPSVPDRVWLQVSTSAADCPGANSCPFGDVCFTELARQKARAADIVVTNHALLAQEVRTAALAPANATSGPATGMFGKRDVIVVDEAHDLPDALTSALSTEVDPRAIAKFLSKAAKNVHDTQITDDGESQTIAAARADLDNLTDALENLPTGALDTLTADTTTAVNTLVSRMILIASLLNDAAKDATRTEKPKRAAAITVLHEQANTLSAALVEARTLTPGRVRWIDQRRPDYPPVLRTAPLEVGEALTKAMEGRTLIATSATLAVAGDFSPIQRTLGLDTDHLTTIDVGSPFNYPNQGMLYIPARPFPEPVGKDRTDHTKAVLDETLALVTAAGGRTLALFTTTAGAQRAADHLRTHLPHLHVLANGDAPADVLVQQFADDEESVLCATMGLWQGVNVPGPSCSLVIIDKVGFAPVDDVLTAARRALADSRRRDGFTEVIVAQAATSLAQAAGRLIRTTSDKGVVAILDPRIHTKGYGRTLLKSLPPFNVYTDRNKVLAALNRLTGGTTRERISEGKADAVTAPARTTGNPYAKRAAIRRATDTKNIAKRNLRPKKID
jgi:ATP-dependent DNA helicase DinG